MTVSNESLIFGLEDGEFKSETRIADFPDPSMNMENFIEKRPVAVLAERFHVIKINSGLEELIIAVANCFQVLSEGYIEVGKEVAKKYVPLLVRLNKSDMDGMEKAIQVLRWVFLSHAADFSTNDLYGKEHRGKGEIAECRLQI